jgi:hypothetical protein
MQNYIVDVHGPLLRVASLTGSSVPSAPRSSFLAHIDRAWKYLTFAQYKAKWGLPDGYPKTHPLLSIKRSTIAKDNGLGGHKRK